MTPKLKPATTADKDFMAGRNMRERKTAQPTTTSAISVGSSTITNQCVAPLNRETPNTTKVNPQLMMLYSTTTQKMTAVPRITQ